ncbi:MAG: XdhC/CoxI family protein [Pseudomonadota bacterium]
MSGDADYDQIPEAALAWCEAGAQVALATVIETWGSAPRPTGSMLAVSGAGVMAGSVSGGCVEGAVVAEAQEALQDGRCRVLEFGVSDDEAFAVGLACGGRIRVMVEPVGVGQGPSVRDLAELVAARAGRMPAAWAVDTERWDRVLVTGPSDALWAQVAPRFRSDRSGFEGAWFVGIHNPPLRMIIVGAVHIAQPLVRMAAMAGYDTTIVDPRAAFASAERFPGQTLVDDWPDEALEVLGLDARTAVVTLTHDPKLDDPAIRSALGTDVFYLGCLGSTRTHAKRVARLAEAGIGADQIARIDAPVGADIGATSPAEIAISIMASVTQTLRKPARRLGIVA